MRKPRIALFTGNYNHIYDGVSHTLNRLVVHLELNGYPVIVFGPWTPEPAIKHTGNFVPVYAIPVPGRPDYRISLGLYGENKKKLLDFNPDIIHIVTPDILGFMGLRYASKYRIPAVSSYHTHFSGYLKYYRLGPVKPILWFYLKWFYRHCKHLYVPSSSMMEELQQKGVKCELKLWSRGVDTSLFHPEKRDLNWRKSKGFTDDDIVIAFVSRLVREKNLEMVAKIFSKIGNRNPSVRTMIVGDGPEKKTLRRMLPDTVFTGHLNHRDLAIAYASSDLFFFPSETESFGNVTLEAMSSKLPAVVAHAIGSRSLVENGVNGFRAEASDEDAFMKHLLNICDDENLRKTMAATSREISCSYDWNRIFDKLIDYYNEVFDKAGHKRTT